MNKINEDKIYEDSFGLWVSGLFGAISGNYPELTFDEQKGVFFKLVHKWLSNGMILFCSPEDPLGKPWDADADHIVEYLLELWPSAAKSKKDVELNFYFHEIPAILWVKDGKIYGS